MFSIALRQNAHTRKYRVTPAAESGWELTMTEDLKPTKHVHFEDWHRVERAVAALQLEVLELTANGWRIEPPAQTV